MAEESVLSKLPENFDLTTASDSMLLDAIMREHESERPVVAELDSDDQKG